MICEQVDLLNPHFVGETFHNQSRCWALGAL